jgi:hypothetical protein
MATANLEIGGLNVTVENLREVFNLFTSGQIDRTGLRDALNQYYKINTPGFPQADIYDLADMALARFEEEQATPPPPAGVTPPDAAIQRLEDDDLEDTPDRGAWSPLPEEDDDLEDTPDRGAWSPLPEEGGDEEQGTFPPRQRDPADITVIPNPGGISPTALAAQEARNPFGVFQRFLRTDPQFAGLSPSLLRFRENQAGDVFSQHLLSTLAGVGQGGQTGSFESFLRGGGPGGFTPELGGQGVDLLRQFIDYEQSIPVGALAPENYEQLSAAANALLGDQDILENALIQNALSQTAPGFVAPLRRGAANIFRLFQSLNPDAGQRGLIDFAQRIGFA